MKLVTGALVLARPLRSGRWPMVAGLLTAYLVVNLIPAATALLVAALVERATSASPDLLAHLAPALGLFAAVLLVGHLGEAVLVPLEQTTKARIDGAHRARVLRLVASSRTIDVLERPQVQSLIRAVSADPRNQTEFTPADGALSQLRWFAGLVGLLAACLVLVPHIPWWLVAWLFATSIVVRYLQYHEVARLTEKLRLAYREELHADVWRQAVISPEAGREMRVFGLADWVVDRMQRHIAVGNTPFWEVLERFAVREWRTLGLVVAGLTPVYVVATLAVLDGSSSTAAQTAVIAAGWALYRSLGELTDVQRMTGAIQVLRSTDRLAAELDDPVLPGGSGRQPAARPVLGIPAVRFEQVSFRYPGTDRLVLDRLDLEIKPGELLAVVGLNGAGKSTLIKLLTGLYRPSGGRILVDGEDLTGLDIDTWRARLSVVFQDFVRYPLSAQDNVVLGMARRPTDRAALEQAAADAGFTGILDALPDGWDTPLVRSRAGGVDLSGGQWQQVVMTRAMYAVRAGARLLVLDEPTAHLDVRAEFEVFHRLAERRRETSVVLISHRLSTVRQADRIVLLHDGRVAESGTHDELIEHGGRYAEMFAVQAERFRRGYDDRIEEGELA